MHANTLTNSKDTTPWTCDKNSVFSAAKDVAYDMPSVAIGIAAEKKPLNNTLQCNIPSLSLTIITECSLRALQQKHLQIKIAEGGMHPSRFV